jgi:hypothetical protein
MPDQDSFRRAGATRCEKQIGTIGTGSPHCIRCCRHPFNVFPAQDGRMASRVDPVRRLGEVGQHERQRPGTTLQNRPRANQRCRVDHDDTGVAGIENARQPISREARVERHVREPREDRAQQR